MLIYFSIPINTLGVKMQTPEKCETADGNREENKEGELFKMWLGIC